MSDNNDLTTSDLMQRVLVSDSISSFDTMPVHLSELDQDTSGQKVTKTLRIYGRNFDEINNFIEGIAFANTVTYNKQDNIPDIYIKNLARVLGWELISSIIENGLLSSYVTTAQSTYEGHAVGLTPVEADIELWRRLVLNSPWLWKSKGTRKAVEFLFKFIGTPLGLINFNEYVYKTDAPLNMELFVDALRLNGLDTTDLSIYPIDSEGYPSPLEDTSSLYFQNYGLWYRETGGVNSVHDILIGNNPHLGPYDGGFTYFKQFKELIPNFSAVTVTAQTITTGTTELFVNYNIGDITNYSGPTYVNGVYDDGTDINECVVVTATVIPDPMPQPITTDCGCSPASDDDALSICVKINGLVQPNLCDKMAGPPSLNDLGYLDFTYYNYNPNGQVINDNSLNPILTSSIYSTKECCNANQGIPTIYSEVSNGVVNNSGFVCCKTDNCGCNVACKWLPVFEPIYLPQLQNGNPQPQEPYMQFIKADGSLGVTTPDGSNCLHGFPNRTIPTPNVVDPFTGEIGYGCKLTQTGLSDLSNGESGIMYNHMLGKKNGNIECCRPLIYK
jgi:hypothetical protein